MSIEKRRIYNLLLLINSFVVLFLTSVLICLLLYYYYPKLSHTETGQIETYEYQFSEVNIFEETTNNGFVTLPTNLEQDEYLTYFNKDSGTTNIVTNFFGGTEYRCSGNCYCVEPSEHRIRRNTASRVLTQGIAAFFSAFSVAMALNLAKDTFFDQCSHEFRDTCSQVEVEIDDCTQVAKMSEFQGASDTLSNPEGGRVSKINLNDPKQSVQYLCKAHCIPLEDPFVENDIDSFFKGEEFTRLGYQNVGLCEALVLEAKINSPTKVEGMDLSPEQASQFSKLAFIQQHPFHAWCIQRSQMKYEWFSESGAKTIQDYMQRVNVEFPGAEELFASPFFCYGYKLFHNEQSNMWMVNQHELENINCVRE